MCLSEPEALRAGGPQRGHATPIIRHLVAWELLSPTIWCRVTKTCLRAGTHRQMITHDYLLLPKPDKCLKFTPLNAKPYLTGVPKVDACFSFDLSAMPLDGFCKMSSCLGPVTMIISPSFVMHGRRMLDVRCSMLDVHLFPSVTNFISNNEVRKSGKACPPATSGHKQRSG